MKIDVDLSDLVHWWSHPVTVKLREEALEERRKNIRAFERCNFKSFNEAVAIAATLNETGKYLMEIAKMISRKLQADQPDLTTFENWELLAKHFELGGKEK